MSRPPKPSLAAIVASATPSVRPSSVRRTAEIVKLDLPATGQGGGQGAGRGDGQPHEPARPSATLKQRARQMSVYLEPPVYEQLREMAHVEHAKMHGLMLEALDLLFKQRGARSIRQITGTDEG